MDESKKRREWVKNAAIIFLSILLVLTFFSNTIMNYSLPEVAAQYCMSGTITNKVRGTGTVESADPYVVQFKGAGTRIIKEVKVKPGDEVKKGDVLYLLEEGDASESTSGGDDDSNNTLKGAKEALTSAKKEYDKMVVDAGYSLDETDVIEKGEKEESDENIYQDKASSLKKASETASDALEAVTEQIDDLEQQISIWKDDYSHNIEEKANLLATKKYYEENKDTWDDILEATKEGYEDYVEAKGAYDSAEEAYKKAKEKYDKKDTDENKKAKKEAKTKRDEAKKKFEEVAKKCETSYSTYLSTYQTAEAAKASSLEADKIIEQKVNEFEEQKAILEDKKYTAEKSSTKASKDFEDFQSDYTKDDELREAYKKYLEAKESYDKLEKEFGNCEVVSPVTGTILEVPFSAGAKINSNTTIGTNSEEGDANGIATVQLAGKGYTLSFAVPREQLKYIAVGDEAEVTNSWWYSDIHAKITSIRADKDNPQGGKIVNFDLDGQELQNGTQLTLTVGKKTANYDTIVPNSAIKEDSNGKFILVVDSKSTPLGNRYIARRVDVTVVAEDETQSAVSGILEGWEYVITTASKPVEDGQQVRLKD